MRLEIEVQNPTWKQVMDYLQNTGWTLYSTRAYLWSHSFRRLWHKVVPPTNDSPFGAEWLLDLWETIFDTNNMEDAIKTLATLERRTSYEIWQDITRQGESAAEAVSHDNNGEKSHDPEMG